MKLKEYLHRYVRITNDEGYSFDGYVAEFFEAKIMKMVSIVSAFQRMLNILVE